jgi:L-aminopeptidase/D-esterase-like protein
VVGALAVVNAFGDVVGEDGRVIAGARSADGARLDPALAGLMAARPPLQALAGANTTLGVVATSAPLTKAAATRVARMAQDGLARAIVPAHTPFDGDLVFVVSTGRSAPADILVLGSLAAEALAHAVRRAVQTAHGVQGIPCIRDLGR